MEYTDSVQRTLDYIEENMDRTLCLEELAGVACFSPFHFHRVFQAMVGEPVMDYTRKRRMTRAAERLFYSHDKVIDIAMEVGFDYQVSFTRAFKRSFGVSPREYRELLRPSGPLRGKAYLTQIAITGGHNMEPKIVKKPAYHVIGYELDTTDADGQNNRDIPEFWQQYIQQNLRVNIPAPLHPNEELGICTDFCPETSEFVYLIGMEVDDETEPPEGLVKRSFPELDYVVFTTPEAEEDSFPSTIQSTWNYIFTEWFPKSEYEHSGDADFELYDERCHGTRKKIDIYIPVKKR
ncbi:AraC family transcriptional regulator [Halobacillus salinus]|uniref:AraC family transcriptional regulator n=1 Tax=Halobacillus salinus TaxID=192814 RepID=A0A4Z0H2Z7_9BACI|nr:AraC family transcriptional regulator [Halobacillus salinus]TGB03781.1 AraC family transcriptional regulator [Halobacillus salinus]